MVALLLGNAFIVGINHVYDVNIDKLNKPFLPVASGEVRFLTLKQLIPIISFYRHNFFPPLLFNLYLLGWTLGAMYSVPSIHTKRDPILAGLTIAFMNIICLMIMDFTIFLGPTRMTISNKNYWLCL